MDVRSAVFQKAKDTDRMIRCIAELTPLCNLSCEMCGISLGAHEMLQYGRMLRIEEWLSLIDQMYDYGVLYLTFSGGEPLLYPEFRQLYIHAYKKGFLIEIRTNGLLLPKYADLFREYPPINIGISVYGSSDEMYERMTGDRNGYTKLTESLDIAATIQSHLHLTCTMTKTNVMCFHDIARLADKHKATFGMITDIFPHVKGGRPNIQTRLTPAECAAIAVYPPRQVQEALHIAHLIEDQYEDAFDLDLQVEQKPIAMCNGCHVNACIKWNGHMTFCPEIESVYALPLQDGINTAWSQLIKSRDTLSSSCERCAKCGLRQFCKGACPARFYLETGSYHTPCQHICKTAYYSKILRTMKGAWS